MSNEELVAAIQSGETERMGELWEQIEKFIAWKAQRIMAMVDESHTIEVADLIQSGYFALVAAVKSYKAGGAPFLKWLSLHLKTAFAETVGYRTVRAQKDPIHSALRIDQPFEGESGATFGEMLQDATASATMETIEDGLWHTQLHDALEAALDSIPPQYSEVIRKRYYDGKALKEIADEKGRTMERVRQLESQGLQQLRKSEYACNLRPFYEFDFYCSTGLQTFRNTGLSVQEQYLIIMENRRQRAENRRREEHERIFAEILNRRKAGL